MITRNACIDLIFGLLVAIGLSACVSARKDIYFQSRVPNIENIEINPPGKLGFNMAGETRRFQVRITRDLVGSFQFYKDKESASFESDNSTQPPKGIDAELTYADQLFRAWPFQLALSYDHVELKGNLFDFRSGDGRGWRSIVNVGVYKTNTWVSTGSSDCNFFCYSSESDKAKVKAEEDNIAVSFSGRESKVGTSFGYYFTKNQALFAGYDAYDAKITASATQKTGQQRTIDLTESYNGYGYGMGYLIHINNSALLSFTVQEIGMNWAGSIFRGLDLNLEAQVVF